MSVHLPSLGLLLALALGCGGPAGTAAAPEATAGRATAPSGAPAADEDAPRAADAPAARAEGLPTDMRQILDAHNELRQRHCAPALAWSAELANTAASWAEQMVARGCTLQHSDHPYGENLYMGTTGVRSPAGVAEQWHSEVRDYDFRRGGFSMRTGHFTQLVWADSRLLGCGTSSCNGLDVWVCMYDPPGNVQDGYRENVKPTSCR